jgi:hypothetical protein
MKKKVDDDEALLLPMTAVLETGNHIGHAGRDGNGTAARLCAQKLKDMVLAALDGKSPFVPLAFWDVDGLREWLGEFPDKANEGVGLGDLTIVKEWKRTCAKNRGRHVYVWSLDQHLSSYDRPPEVR